MTTRDARTLDAILDRDAALAVADAQHSYLIESVELAPLSYVAMRAMRDAGTLAAELAALPAHLLRPQAVRFLVERQRITGQRWGWGDVADVARRFQRLIDTMLEETMPTPPACPTCGSDGSPCPDCNPDLPAVPAPIAPRRPAGDAAAALPAPELDGSYALPAPGLVRAILSQLAATAQAAGDAANANALSKADYQLAQGLYPALAVAADGAILIPSRTTAGTVYRVGETGCGCQAGAHGRPCWHGALVEAILVARDEVAGDVEYDLAELAA